MPERYLQPTNIFIETSGFEYELKGKNLFLKMHKMLRAYF